MRSKKRLGSSPPNSSTTWPTRSRRPSGRRSMRATAWRKLLNYVNRYDMNDPEHFQVVEKQLDMPAMADYLLPLIYAANDDWPHNNWRAARERGSRSSEGPAFRGGV